MIEAITCWPGAFAVSMIALSVALCVIAFFKAMNGG